MSDGFTDLRLNRQEGQTQESFWPSFTDIMTVIVMIFLISMVVLLMRNMELVNQLRATMEAERIAAELARATGEEKDSLSVALGQSEEHVQELQLEVMHLSDRKLRHEMLIAEQIRAITGLSNERDDLTQQAAQLMLLRQRLEADVKSRKEQIQTTRQQLESKNLQLSAAQQNISSLEQNVGSLRDRLSSSELQADQLQQTIGAQRQTIEKNRQRYNDVERKYLVLTGDYDHLKVKYDKLIRPARSATGRHVIEVRYWKEGDALKITWREGTQDPYQSITPERLDAILKRLADEKVNGLYIKVIFPEKSGLSYNEAWGFTNHLHRNYDYYFRDTPQAE